MAQQLTIKAYLRRWNPQTRQQEQADEIRRFAVDLDVATNYEYMLAKVASVFPGLVNKSLDLFWKDADNDMIAFSSDDELMEALKSVNDSLFRIFIFEKAPAATPSAQPPSSTAGLLHFGVTCDGCEGPVYGIRYKCVVCPDYDLCSNCKGLGLHSEHEMRTINTPVIPHHLFGHFNPNGGPGFAPPQPPPYVFCQPPPPPPACNPGQAFPEHPFDPEEMRQQRRAWKRWYKEMYGSDHKRRMKKEKKAMKQMKKAEKKNEKEMKEPGADSKSSDSSSSESEAEASPGSEFLKTVGNSVAAMLDPLGIDVQVDVESKGHRRRCHRGMMGGRGGWGWHGMRGGPPHCGPWGMRGGRWNSCPWRGPFAAGCPRPGEQQFAQQQQPNQPSGQPSAAPPNGENAPQPNAATNLETGEMASENFGGCDQGWTLVTDGGSADVEGTAEGVNQLHLTASLGSIPMIPLIPAMPADPKIANAVQQMMSMGYDNENGWLTQLLMNHNGDIGHALDAINAKK